MINKIALIKNRHKKCHDIITSRCQGFHTFPARNIFSAGLNDLLGWILVVSVPWHGQHGTEGIVRPVRTASHICSAKAQISPVLGE